MLNLPISKSLFPKFTGPIQKLMAWAHPNLWVYDIETYPNFFSMAVTNAKTLECYYFELSPWYNNLQELSTFLYYLNDKRAEMVGFNNQGFDWPVLDYIFRMIPSGVNNMDIYNKVRSIFDTDFDDRFKHVIWGNQQYIKQIDLFKINHYDNFSKATSLKMLENNMGMENIQELPIAPNTNIPADQRNNMYLYNWHDVAATLLFLAYNIGQINLRNELGVKYSHDFTNASDAKIGSDIVKIELKKAGLPVDKKTFRDEIKFSECIFDYVTFERPEFNEIKNWLMNTTITKTKEALNNIDVPWSLVRYMNPDDVIVRNLDPIILKSMRSRKGMKIKLSAVPIGEPLHDCVFIAEHLHVVVDGFQFDFGTGGIHGSISSAVVKTTATHKLIDVDAKSYYPNIGTKNKLYPQHLGEPYCDVVDDLYILRGCYSKKKFPMINKAIKLALNAGYGNSNSSYSFLYDPKYTMSITLNGQLMLCMLSEHLMKVPGLTMVQINTDGVTYNCPNEYVEHTMALCRWWEAVTNLELEDVEYQAMYIRDVNNYIAVTKDGERKYKGAYEYNLDRPGDEQWHKNFSMRIVGMAAEVALCDGINVDDFIKSKFGHDENRELFCLRSKVDRNSLCKIIYNGVEHDQQRITRYYAALDGGELIKIMPPTDIQRDAWNLGDHYMHEVTGAYVVKQNGVKPPSGKYKPVPQCMKQNVPQRRERIESTCSVQPCNVLSEFDWVNLDIQYYINEANKLVVPLL